MVNKTNNSEYDHINYHIGDDVGGDGDVHHEDEHHEIEEIMDEEDTVGAGSVYEAPKPKSSPSDIIGKYRRFLIPVGLVLAIFIFYKMLGWYSHHKQNSVEKKAQPVKTMVATDTVAKATIPAILAQPITVGNVKESLETQAVPAAVSSDVNKQLSTIADHEQQNRDHLTAIESKIEEHKSDLSRLHTEVSNLTASVDSLTDNVNSLVERMKKAAKPAKKPVVHKAVYHVKALVPGRAWLEDTEGNTITVRLGDMLNGGRVEFISPADGTVAISTGEIIQYGSNDI